MNPNVVLMTLVIALEPIPILGGVLLLTAKRGRPKAVAFMLGWALALAIVGLIVVFVGQEVSTPSGSTSSKVSAVLDIVLGLALIVVALRTRAKKHPDGVAPTPGWMQRIDTMSPIAAFALGMFLPPYLIAAAIGNDIIREHTSTTARVVAMILYVVVGSIGILVPILVTVVRPDTADARLASWRTWLQANWQTLMVWLLIGIGVYLGVKGLVELQH